MTEQIIDEDITIKNRILLRELRIKNLKSKRHSFYHNIFRQIKKISEENKKIIDSENVIMEKVASQSKKMSLLVKLIYELKNNFEEDNEETQNNMLVDN